MRAAIALRYVIGKAQHIFVIAVIPLQRGLHQNAIAFTAYENRRVGYTDAVAVKMGHKRLHAAIITHDFFVGLDPTQVAETYGDARVQKCQFAQAMFQRFAVKFDHGEDGC